MREDSPIGCSLASFYGLILVNVKKYTTFALGKMAEWSIAAVLKTVELRGSGGSNPSLSAKSSSERCQCKLASFFV